MNWKKYQLVLTRLYWIEYWICQTGERRKSSADRFGRWLKISVGS